MMSEVKTSHELASLLGSTLTSTDPIKAIEDHGYTLSAELRQKLESTEIVPKLPEEERQRWAERAKDFGPSRFTVGEPSPFSLASLAPGEYDLILGFRMDLLHEALEGLYATHVIPHGLPAHTDEKLVIDVLRGLFDGIPEGEKIETGTFHLTAAPTMSPVDGTERVSLHQPFELDIDRVSSGMFHGTVVREKVASLVGTLHLTMSVDVEVVGVNNRPKLGVRLIPVDPLGNLPDEQRFRIEVDAGSTIQPQGQQVLDDIEMLIALFMKNELEGKQVWTVTPEIDLKEYTGGGPLVVGSVDVRTVVSPVSGAVMIGVRFGWPGPGHGDPQRLTNPFVDQSANIYARVHIERLRMILQEMQESSELGKLAKEEHEDARIEKADVELGENEIRIKLKGKVVDACGFWKDLPFEAVHTIHFEFLPDRVRITRSTSINTDGEDVFWCAVLSVLQVVAVGVAVGVATGGLGGIALGALAGLYVGKNVPFFEMAYDELFGEGEGPEVSLFKLRTPISGTELLPRITGAYMRATADCLEHFYSISLVPDEINTYLYARFLYRDLATLARPVEPLSGVKVQLLDQDFPKPTFDDVKIPLEEEEIVIEGGSKVIVIKLYAPPESDEVLKVEKTDWTGLARFMLRPHELQTTAGTVFTTTTKITEFHESGETTEKPIREQLPDVYFRVHTDFGVRDTSKSDDDEGLMVNLRMKRVGSADAPLTFLFKKQGVFA
jgi:hypothetical protein